MLMFPSSIKNPIIINGPEKQGSLSRKGGEEAGLLRPGCEKGELKRGKKMKDVEGDLFFLELMTS
jgi:hypothetical protein